MNNIQKSEANSPRKRNKRRAKIQMEEKAYGNKCLLKDEIPIQSHGPDGKQKEHVLNKVNHTAENSLENSEVINIRNSYRVGEGSWRGTLLMVDSVLPICESLQSIDSTEDLKPKQKGRKKKIINAKPYQENEDELNKVQITGEKPLENSLKNKDFSVKARCQSDGLLKVDSTLQLLVSERVEMATNLTEDPIKWTTNQKQKKEKRKGTKKKCDHYKRRLDEQHCQGENNVANEINCMVADPEENLEGLKNENILASGNCGQQDRPLKVDSAPQLSFFENQKDIESSVEQTLKGRKRRKKKQKDNCHDYRSDEKHAQDEVAYLENEVNSAPAVPISEHVEIVKKLIKNPVKQTSSQKKSKKGKQKGTGYDIRLDVKHGQEKADDRLENGVDSSLQLPISENLEKATKTMEVLAEQTSNRKKSTKKKHKGDYDNVLDVKHGQDKDDHLEDEVDSASQLPTSVHLEIASKIIENTLDLPSSQKNRRKKTKNGSVYDIRSNEKHVEEKGDHLGHLVDSTPQLSISEHLDRTIKILESPVEQNSNRQKNRKKSKKHNGNYNIQDEKLGQEKNDVLNRVQTMVANQIGDSDSLKKEKILVRSNVVQVDSLVEVDSATQLLISASQQERKINKRNKLKSKANGIDHQCSTNGMNYGLCDRHGLEKCDDQNTSVTEEIKSSASKDNLLQKAAVHCSRRKLLILDVNGLLADIVVPPPKNCVADIRIHGRAIFIRPFYYEFLKFCFEKFDVAIWSSRSKSTLEKIVHYLLGDLRHKLLFCWDASYCTKTSFKTLDNRHKPLICKELRTVWEKHDPLSLPWEKGDYDESNTLLLDDSPYKALFNPAYTGVFPYPYKYNCKNDNTLGPGGDLRVYLEGLAKAENVQKYVEDHPYGQGAINETSPFWNFYSRVIYSRQLASTSNGSTCFKSQ